jgi:Leucine Rich Repeat (LRR) protein
MVGIFGKKKKSEVEKLIEQDGIEHATRRFSEVISKKLKTIDMAYQFILEEVEAASQGNNMAVNFAKSSGISLNEYKGAMKTATPEIDGADDPQQLLLRICSQLMDNTDLMAEFRVRIADNIMKQFFLGKYSSDKPLGISKYETLKEYLSNEDIAETLILSASGVNQVSMTIASEVNEAVRLINYISSLIDISGIELINAITENEYDEQIQNVILEKEKQKDYEYAGDDGEWINELIAWADQHELPELQSFDSPAYRQTGFPRNKKQIMSLEYLHLPSCNISQIPAGISNLKSLQAICLDENQITEIPSEICRLENLTRLDLDNNLISHLPKEIGRLRNLHTLSLQNNSIKDFPAEMKNLINLRKLDLKGLKIHLSSKYSPLSPDGFDVYIHFQSVIKEDNVSYWLQNTDTSNFEITG